MRESDNQRTAYRSRTAWRVRARQWSRAAWALGALCASLPISSRLFLGVWGFETAAEVACLCGICGAYLHLVSRRGSPAIPDSADMLDEAIQLGRLGQVEDAIGLLTEAIRLSPRLWQAYQYRGELYLLQQASPERAIEDFGEAIRLVPAEPHLYLLRAQAHALLGDDASSQRDYETGVALAGRDDGTHSSAPR